MTRRMVLAVVVLAGCAPTSQEGAPAVQRQADSVAAVQCNTGCAAPRLSAGYLHSLVVANDGVVWASGGNAMEQVGPARSAAVMTPVQVAGLPPIVQVSAGETSSMALAVDGGVWFWGAAGFEPDGGQGPVQLPISARVTSLCGGHALADDGTVWTLAAGGASLATDFPPARALACAGSLDTVLLILPDGGVMGRGDNSGGQLGDGTRTSAPTAFVRTKLGVAASAVSIGAAHGLALDGAGTVWAWGWNGSGALGDGTTDDHLLPAQVPGLSDVVAIAAGGYHSVALEADGTVWAWGSNYDGQVGDGTFSSRLSPTLVGPSHVVAIAAGWLHTLALTADGEVWAWGMGASGARGDGPVANKPSPVTLALGDLTAVAAGASHVLVLRSDGGVVAWGYDSSGQAGGTLAIQDEPLPVPMPPVVALAAKSAESFALTAEGTVWGWGANGSGQLGDGTTMDRRVPVQLAGLTGVTALAPGPDFTLAVVDGGVFAWGANAQAQLGDGTTTPRLTPALIEGLTDVTEVAAGDGRGVALRKDGSVWIWGARSYFFPDAGAIDLTRPSRLLAGARGIAATDQTVGVVLADGSVLVWADIVVGPSVPSSPGLGGIIALSAGDYGGFLALSAAGDVWAWSEQQTQGLALDQTPKLVAAASPARSLAVGQGFWVVVREDGVGVGWGTDEIGQLGDAPTLGYTPHRSLFSLGQGCHQAAPTCVAGTCATFDCAGHGTCAAEVCTCATGYAGAVCAHCDPQRYGPACVFCEPSTTCGGHGACSWQGSCVCATGFAGGACQYSDVATCSSHGAAQPDGTCLCASSFAGASCERCADGGAAYPACTPAVDAGTPDAGAFDAGADAGSADAGLPDAGLPDAGNADAGNTDAGNTDAGMPDAGGADAGLADAGVSDAGSADAGDSDAGNADAGDAGAPDAGAVDAGADLDAGVDAGPGDAGNTDAGAGDAGQTTVGAVGQIELPAGCGCSGAPSGALPFVLAGLARRRRRPTPEPGLAG